MNPEKNGNLNFFPPNQTERTLGNSNAHNQFLSKNQRWTQTQVRLFCHKYSAIPLDPDEVAQQIRIGLWQALLSYNPAKGVPPNLRRPNHNPPKPHPTPPQPPKTPPLPLPRRTHPNKQSQSQPTPNPRRHSQSQPAETALNPSRNPQSPPQRQPSPNRPTALPRLCL